MIARGENHFYGGPIIIAAFSGASRQTFREQPGKIVPIPNVFIIDDVIEVVQEELIVQDVSVRKEGKDDQKSPSPASPPNHGTESRLFHVHNRIIFRRFRRILNPTS